MSRSQNAATLVLRMADDEDAISVTRLAALDSAPVPERPLLLGLLDDRPVVALSLATGALVADPFTPTLDVIALVRRRAERLDGPPSPAVASRRRTAAHAGPSRLSTFRP